MDLKDPVGYRPYETDPHIATGFSNLAEHQAGVGYAALVAAIAERLAQRIPTKHPCQVVCLDLYQSPEMDTFIARVREAWEAAHGRAQWIDTRTALKDARRLDDELQEFLTNDPVFGRVCDRELTYFFDTERWQALVESVNAAMHEADNGT